MTSKVNLASVIKTLTSAEMFVLLSTVEDINLILDDLHDAYVEIGYIKRGLRHEMQKISRFLCEEKEE